MAIKELKREWCPSQLAYVKEFLLHTEDELQHMPRCSVGSKATVSETDNEYVKTTDGWMLLCDCDEDGGTGAGGGGVQPDWNQNDPSAADYVKNRTHYDAKYSAACDLSKQDEYVCLHNTDFRDSKGQTHTATSTKTWYRISDLTPAPDILWATGRAQGNGTEMLKISERTDWNIMWDTEDFCSIGHTNTRNPYAFLFVVYKPGATLVLGPDNTAMCEYTAIAPEPGVYVVVSTTTDGNNTLFEYLEWGTIVPLDPKFLPAGSGGAFVVNFIEADDGTDTADKTFAEIAEAIENMKYVYGRLLSSTGSFEVVHLVGYWPESAVAFSYMEIDGNTVVQMYITISSDNVVTANVLEKE